jgi:hypothetical protein
MSEGELLVGTSSSIHKSPVLHADVPLPEPLPQQQSRKSQSKGPSLFTQSIRAVFGFRKTSLTLFVAVTLVVVFLSVPLSRDNALTVPAPEPEELTAAWLDLQRISLKPHPYVSHANDEVHDYILQRANALASKSELNITVDDDMASGLTYFNVHSIWKSNSPDYFPLHHFKSSNVLVKIEGKDPKLDGVLLSAHYDSVGTSYGTTDDGGGVATLLGILEHYATTGEKPLRTIVLNFNNNEEFGLYGAIAFFEHSWSKLVKYVINLEGTGTGERAILFRCSDYGVAQLYSSVRSPFASSIFQQGFATGVVKSETDYRIYTENGMRGFDIAFYKPRDLYHTPSDSIKHTSKGALWHMLGNALDLTKALANAKTISEDAETSAVFFDLLGLTFFVIPLKSLVTINMALLIAIPFTLLFFGVVIHKRKIWNTGFSWLRLPVSLLISGVAANFMNYTIYHFNPYVVSRDFLTPLIAVSSTFLFFNYAVLTISQSFWPVHDLKLIITLEVFAALWIILLYATIIEKNSNSVTGLYLFTIVYFLYGVSSILGLFGISIAVPKKKVVDLAFDSIESTAHYQQDDYNESSPLLANPRTHEIEDGTEQSEGETHPEHNSFTYDWSLQYFILVPVSFLLSYISVELVLEGLNQTIQESLASHELLYTMILFFSFLLTIPLLSFAYKLNYLFAIVLILTIFGSGLQSLFLTPFTADAPIKFRFAQAVDLSNGSHPTVEIFGREGFLKDLILDLPSIKESKSTVSCKPQGDGNEICFYDSAERPYLANGTTEDNNYSSYLNVEILKTKDDSEASPYSPMKAEISINAEDNRHCFVSFNTTSYKFPAKDKSPVRIVTIYNDKALNASFVDYELATLPSGGSRDSKGNEVYKFLQGIDDISLHKTSWDQKSYHLGIQWVPKWLEDGEEQEPVDSPNNRLGINVVCYWGEWDDVSIVDGIARRKVPAFDELLQYSPETTSFSNRYEGLVKIEKYVEL